MAVLYQARVVPVERPRPNYLSLTGRYVDYDQIERQLVLSYARHSNLPFFRGIDTRGIPCLQGL